MIETKTLAPAHARPPEAGAAPGRAPDIKAWPDGLSGAHDELMGAFEAFREANDRRLGEIEKKLAADVVTTEKVERINRAIDQQTRLLDELALKAARPPLGELRPEGAAHAPPELKAAFEAYVRRGDEGPLRDLEAKAYSASVSSDGGVVVPPEIDTAIGRRVAMISPMRRLATVRQISGAVLKKPFATNGLATGWVAETAARPQTGSQTLAELSFPTQELFAQPAATQALLDDAAVDIESWIASEVEIVFAEQEGTAFIAGDGVNKPKGLVTYNTVADGAWSWGSIGYVATGVANGFRAQNPSDTLFDVIYALKAGYRQNGTFLMNRKTQGEIRKLKDTTGNYIWQPPAAAGTPASLAGFPLAESEDMPDIASGGMAIAFGDFRAAYLVVDRMGTRLIRDPYTAKPYVLFYVTRRVGGGVQNFEAVKFVRFAVS
ncbi:phage major capsid protein [Gellertiella hungarica]|uniref:HK97 family phage major capsid protein n=1 Tax=Gellertiella hungarica TaxID=1572859 RepID=A0A7W6J6L5_9HYPH|nr:phage major capsid protein [Gellertiella hungarica]MBB4065729.1 HK97 family phage major capsid protein [Gellertiella hungarica]